MGEHLQVTKNPASRLTLDGIGIYLTSADGGGGGGVNKDASRQGLLANTEGNRLDSIIEKRMEPIVMYAVLGLVAAAVVVKIVSFQ